MPKSDKWERNSDYIFHRGYYYPDLRKFADGKKEIQYRTPDGTSWVSKEKAYEYNKEWQHKVKANDAARYLRKEGVNASPGFIERVFDKKHTMEEAVMFLEEYYDIDIDYDDWKHWGDTP